MQTTTFKTSIKNLPEQLRDALKASGCNRRRASLVIVHDDNYRVLAWDTRWGGGSRNEYRAYHFGATNLPAVAADDGARLAVQPGAALVVVSVCCGLMTDPAVYVRDVELTDFLGFMLPHEHKETPAAVKADVMDEIAEGLGGRKADQFRKGAALVREALGIATR